MSKLEEEEEGGRGCGGASLSSLPLPPPPTSPIAAPSWELPRFTRLLAGGGGGGWGTGSEMLAASLKLLDRSPTTAVPVAEDVAGTADAVLVVLGMVVETTLCFV